MGKPKGSVQRINRLVKAEGKNRSEQRRGGTLRVVDAGGLLTAPLPIPIAKKYIKCLSMDCHGRGSVGARQSDFYPCRQPFDEWTLYSRTGHIQNSSGVPGHARLRYQEISLGGEDEFRCSRHSGSDYFQLGPKGHSEKTHNEEVFREHGCQYVAAVTEICMDSACILAQAGTV